MNISAIRIDGGTQSRVSINTDAVAEYAEAMTAGEVLPPALVFFDGVDHWLADGFHRYHAHRRIGAATIECEIRAGTLQDAKLYAYGANKVHGLRRSNDDKRKAVLGMLADFGGWSDNKIAKHVGVSDKTVGAHRASIFGNSEDAPAVRTVERAGKTYQQDTSRIGKAAPPPAKRPEASPKRAPGSIPDAVFAAPDYAPSAEELADSEQGLLDELTTLRRVADADDHLAEALAMIKQRDALVAGLQSRIDGLLAENSELVRSVKYWRRQAEKAAAA